MTRARLLRLLGLAGVLFGLGVAATPSTARAELARYALVIGHNTGDRDDLPLRYAEEDARRLADVLGELGGFRGDRVVVLRGPTPDAVQATLIELNDRIRTRGEPALLVVFYSGHADARALHLGEEVLPLSRLEQLVRGSAAAFRLLIVDACRSGALTRAKGGAPIAAPPIRLARRLPSEGVVFWTSSSANEDAQESEELRGSFFTHYLVSGLLGAADANGDGAVTLSEAYSHAYEATLRASSRTLAGLQHATYREETRGLSDLTLTWLAAKTRGLASFPAGHDYLIMQGGRDGPVIAEVSAHDPQRRISLRAGGYFLRARAAKHLLEGRIAVRAGQLTAVDEDSLDRVEYARLVRKGGGLRERADRLELGYTIRAPLWSDASPCQGAALGWAMDLPDLSLGARLAACRGGATNRYLEATHDQLAAEARLTKAWDLRAITLGAGLLTGAAVLSQRFDAASATQSRTSLAGTLGVTLTATRDLTPRAFLSAELDGVTWIFREQAASGETSMRATFAPRLSLLTGARW